MCVGVLGVYTPAGNGNPVLVGITLAIVVIGLVATAFGLRRRK